MELPDLQELQKQYGEAIFVVGVDIGPFVGLGNSADAIALLDELNISFPNGNTDDLGVLREFEAYGTPATYFITPDGEIIQKWVGYLTKDQLVKHIENLIVQSNSG